MTIQIEEFRFNDKPWCITWLGRIIYPPSSSTEPRITVHLAELLPGFSDPLSAKSQPEPPKYQQVSVKVGLIALLKIGSVWLNGVRVPVQSKNIECTLAHEKCHLVRFDDKVRIGDSQEPIFAPNRYRIGRDALIESSSSWVVVIYDPTPALRLMVIPATILFQQALATSPKAVRQLVYGQLDKIVDPSSGSLLDKPNTFYMILFKDFRDLEGPALANLIADPIASKEYARFRQSLTTESVNHREHGQPAAHIKLNLPFTNPVQLKANGKFMPFRVQRGKTESTEWGFLATEITDLQTRLCFDRLIIDRKNSAKKGLNANDPDLIPSYGGRSRSPVELDMLVLTSKEEPADHLEAACVEASGNILDLSLELIDDPKLVQKYRSRPRAPHGTGDPDGTASPGDPSGNGSTTELNVKTIQTPEIPVTLNEFFKTLAFVVDAGYPFRTIPVSSSFRQQPDNTGVVNFLPWHINKVRSWHLSSDSSSAPPRGYVVAELCHGGVWRYLIEIQRKGAEALALLYVRHHSGQRIETPELAQFMLEVARENGWGAKDHIKKWVCTPIKHRPKKGAETFALDIIKQL
ncbi:hypothetical protein [Aquipseudomonas guryensis]|uniref:TnsE C-terminal domain-containing protein n=1 Tax=Aquipseudomonas guryensis TaxID=2759165 RepID=A0A7W4D999_9GAMM|nr:hypothetical protein [Pseudomonas guryensis]MBB1518372.1 hypothetical protein [Pseudomonas guryensis]